HALSLNRGDPGSRERSHERRRAGEDDLDVVAGEPDEPARGPVERFQHQDLFDSADQAPPELVTLRPAELTENPAAVGDRARVQLIREPRGLGALARRVWEDVQVGER